MDYTVSFSKEMVRDFDELVTLAAEVWSDCKPSLGDIRVMAGNAASYGSYAAKCHTHIGVIEFPVANKFSIVELQGRELAWKCREAGRGTFMHELGHSAVHTAQQEPWSGLPQIGPTTHTCRSWLWICTTAWKHFHGESPTPADIVKDCRGDGKKKWVDCLRSFDPFTKPPKAISSKRNCDCCGEEYLPKRSTSKFCSTKCRVYFNS